MKFTLRDYLEIAIIVALMIVLGFFFYSLGRILVFPGSKILTQATFLGFMLACILHRVRKMGALILTGFVFGGIMSFITVLMGAVILLSAILAESIAYIIFKRYHDVSIKITVAMFAIFAFLLTLIASVYVTGSEFAIEVGSNWHIIIVSVAIAFLLGLIGGILGVRLMNKRLQKGIEK